MACHQNVIAPDNSIKLFLSMAPQREFLPNRRSVRLVDYDYSTGGAYFVTICTFHNECTLGEIKNGNMTLNDYGRIVHREWYKSAAMRPGVELDEFIIMPNHVHGIIVVYEDTIADAGDKRRATSRSPLRKHDLGARQAIVDAASALTPEPDLPTSGKIGSKAHGPVKESLGAIIAGFKSSVTLQCNSLGHTPGRPFWQRNYYEHVIRSETALQEVRQYIVDNPLKWHLDHAHSSIGSKRAK
jgi:putative transposase